MERKSTQMESCDELQQTIAFYKSKQPPSGSLGCYVVADWQRLHTAYSNVIGDSVLDVGIGNGALLHVLTRSRRFDRVVGVDIRQHSSLILPDDAEFRAMSVAELEFDDDEFDTVVCMEVLEHLEDPQFQAALPELRRVARRRLVMTVPFEEPLPLWWHDKPGGHRQHFTEQRLKRLFPATNWIMQERPGSVDWVFLVEQDPSPGQGAASELNIESAGAASSPVVAKHNADRILEMYYREFGTSQAQEHVRDRINWMIAQARGKRVLDAGCSQGVVSLLLGRAGFEVLGLDVRPSVIEFANAQLKSETDKVQDLVRFAAGDLGDIEAPDGSFDSIILGEVLEHQSHPQHLLAALQPVLAAKGRVVATVPFGFHRDVDHKQTFYLSDFRSLVSEFFEVEELFVQHKFISCIAAPKAAGKKGVAPKPQAYREMLEASEKAFLEAEKTKNAEMDELRRISADLKAQLDSNAQRLDNKFAARERELLQQIARYTAGHERSIALQERLQHKDWMIRHKDQSIREKSDVIRKYEREIARLRGGIAPRLAGAVLSAFGLRDDAPGSAKEASPVIAKQRESYVHRVDHPALAITVACILDEFSWENLRPECNLYRLSARHWKEDLKAKPPAFLLVESAWFGNNGDWQYRITYTEPRPDNPLFALLEYCRAEGIPTVFWNKEDPPNYDKFIDAAKRFDCIFTTDSNCLPKYEQDAPDANLGVLPFAAQPATQNPVNIDRIPKLGDVCFAGAWYPRHPERHKDAKLLLQASKGHRLHIYDRYLNHPQANKYRFPDEFQPYIEGTLGFEEMVEKYRQYRLFLNVNSVNDSPTMFSRRVLELLACGTPVVSGYAEGVATMLGSDVVPMCSTVEEATNAIDRVLSDRLYRDELVLKGQRKIFSQHTYRHRVRLICETLGIALPEPTQMVSVITATIRRGFVDQLLRNFQRQSYPNKELLVVINEGAELIKDYVLERARTVGVEGARVIVANATDPLGRCLNIGIENARGEIFAKMDDDDYYGEHYLEDSVLALRYSGADCVGKESYFTYVEGTDETYERTPGRQHQMTKFVIGTTVVAHKNVYPHVSFGDTRVGEDTIFLERLDAAGLTLYSHSRYNYVKFFARSIDHHTWKISQDEYLKGAEFLSKGDAKDRVCF